MRRHWFVGSGHEDLRGVPICECGSAQDASVHRIRERSDEERAVEARRIGER